MAITLSDNTILTKAGIFLRLDASECLFAFSPYTGLVYAIPESEALDTLQWLSRNDLKPGLSNSFVLSLGVGWRIPVDSAIYDTHRLLPDLASWPTAPVAQRPIVINWLITGHCAFSCRYCYAQDLMRGNVTEPSSESLEGIANTILSYNPLAVTITGGDPLLSNHLRTAIEYLSKKTGIIVDTSGFSLSDEHIRLFQRHHVTVRISLDTERPRINDYQRCQLRAGKISISATQVAVDAICRCIEAGLSLTVQSVATKKTANDLLSLGDKLYRIGIRSWRILKIAPTPYNFSEYRLLVGIETDDGRPIKGKLAKGPYDFIFSKLLKYASSDWGNKMAVQISSNAKLNEVILVAPDGQFYTESTTGHGKILIDNVFPYKPRLDYLNRYIDMSAHTERYLGTIPRDLTYFNER